MNYISLTLHLNLNGSKCEIYVLSFLKTNKLPYGLKALENVWKMFSN